MHIQILFYIHIPWLQQRFLLRHCAQFVLRNKLCCDPLQTQTNSHKLHHKLLKISKQTSKGIETWSKCIFCLSSWMWTRLKIQRTDQFNSYLHQISVKCLSSDKITHNIRPNINGTFFEGTFFLQYFAIWWVWISDGIE